MIKRILMPIDQSENSGRIQSWVTGLAKPLDAEIVLLTVIDPEKIYMPHVVSPQERALDRSQQEHAHTTGGAYIEPSGVGVILSASSRGAGPEQPQVLGTQVIDQAVTAADRYLAHLADQIRSEGIRVTTTVEIGDPATQIIKAATDEQVELIGMATHRKSVLARGILGSVTDRVIHSSTIPVMTNRPGRASGRTPRMPDVVVVPLDGSRHSESAFPFAIDIAKATGASMVLTRATGAPFYSAAAESGVYYTSQITLGMLTEQSRLYLEPFVEAAEAEGIDVAIRTPMGAAARAIMAIADEEDNTLIVMGSRGTSGLKRWILGSVADKVIRASGHPVIVVPPVSTRSG
ncbi:MAG: universal stress protein [Chloroflexi bacterium]|nr:universal stress protein [Chloroflexota bacterium]